MCWGLKVSRLQSGSKNTEALESRTPEIQYTTRANVGAFSLDPDPRNIMPANHKSLVELTGCIFSHAGSTCQHSHVVFPFLGVTSPLHTYIPTYIPTYLHTYIPTYIPTYLPTYIHTYIHTDIHRYIHTYIHKQMFVYF